MYRSWVARKKHSSRDEKGVSRNKKCARKHSSLILNLFTADRTDKKEILLLKSSTGRTTKSRKSADHKTDDVPVSIRKSSHAINLLLCKQLF